MRLYKVEITAYPEAEAKHYAAMDAAWLALGNGHFDEAVLDGPGWEPDGWLADPDKRTWWMERHNGDTAFYWPSTKTVYRTRSGAETRAELIRSYGAEVEVIESDEIVWLTEEIRRQRRIAELHTELAALEGRPVLAVVA